MIVGYHITIAAYGFWLPNDPRGSWSDYVGAWELLRFGHATKTTARRSVAKDRRDPARRLHAKAALPREEVVFNGLQARVIGRAFKDYFSDCGRRVYACAILPEHIHLVVGRGTLRAESLAIQLKGAATRRLLAEGLHPFADSSRSGRAKKCFSRGSWSVYLDLEDVNRAIRYVEENPLKEGKPRQTWSFVSAFVP